MENHLKNVLPQDMQELLDNNATIIDIRTDEEFNATGIIKGSHKLTFFDSFGNYDMDKWMSDFENIIKDKKDTFVLVCAHASRTRNVGEYLASKLEYENCYHLEGGISLWLKQGKETVR